MRGPGALGRARLSGLDSYLERAAEGVVASCGPRVSERLQAPLARPAPKECELPEPVYAYEATLLMRDERLVVVADSRARLVAQVGRLLGEGAALVTA